MKIELYCALLVLCDIISIVSCKRFEKKETNPSETNIESTPGTLMIGKLVLVPILAGIGLKVLMLLPIFLSKIALLGVLSFVSSNLSLLISAIVGTKHFFFGSKHRDNKHKDYDYVDYREYSHPEHHRPMTAVNHEYVRDYHRGKHDGTDFEAVESYERTKDDDRQTGYRHADAHDDVDRTYRRNGIRSGSLRLSDSVWAGKDRHYYRHYAVKSPSSSSPGSYEVHEKDSSFNDPRKKRR